MNALQRSGVVGRRTILKAGATVVALQVTSPFIIRARGETPVRIGLVDPLTGVYAAIAQSEVEGARLAIDQLNQSGGILGQPVELLVEDSANDVGIGVQKTRKLIERDQVSFIIGDVNSGIAIAMTQVTSEKKVLHIVSGGHTDAITGSSCSWNVFRVCNSTTMDANAIAATLIEKFGKKWYFLTPDYAYGHSVQASFEKLLKAQGGTSAGSVIPLGTPEYSAYLIQAKAYSPQVLINVMGGNDQVNSLKQFVQFGLDKQMTVAGTLFELESLRAVPNAARIGWWTMEWWWDQPNTPHVKEFNATIRQRTGRAATARDWFGYVSVYTLALIANQEKTLDSVKLAHALSGLKRPPEIALQPGLPEYRGGDHELMSTVFVGEAHPPQVIRIIYLRCMSSCPVRRPPALRRILAASCSGRPDLTVNARSSTGFLARARFHTWGNSGHRAIVRLWESALRESTRPTHGPCNHGGPQWNNMSDWTYR